MNILMLTHYFSPRIGGVETVVHKLAEYLDEYKLIVVTEKYDKRLSRKEEFNSWTTVYRFEYPHKKYIGLLNIWKWMFKNKHLIDAADLVHIHDVFVWYLPFRLLFPFKPVYVTYHGWEGKLPIPLSSLIQKKLSSYLSNGTIVVGKHLEKYNGIKADVVTYNGTDLPKEQRKKSHNKFVYVGRLSKETGLDLVLDTIKQLNDINIEFCGDGQLRSQCEVLGRVHGFVKDPTPFLAKAEFCFAGGFLTTFEAFANKCLVFVCYQNAIKEDYFKMAPFAKYMVIEGSPEKLAQKIRYYQTHKREREEMVEGAYNFVKTQTWERVAEQYKKLWGLT
jgi:glycosyltransferase involved in cell wall biosynthesis